MAVPRTEYLTWAVGRYERARIDLASSGAPALTAAAAAGSKPPPQTDTAAAFVRLRDVLAEREGWRPDEVLATAGATGAMTLACAALVGPGDHVLVERPGYEPLLRIPEGFGAVVDRFDRRYEDGWRIDPDAIAAAIRPGTKLVIVTEPHNPTGILSPPTAIAAACAAAERAGARLLVNEVYRRFHSAPSSRLHDPRILVADSVTKFEGLWWARGGWLAAPADLIARARDAQVTLSVASPVSAAWAAATVGRPDLVERSLALASPQKRRIVAGWVRSDRHLSWIEPPAGLFGLVRVARAPDLREIADRLEKTRGVLFVPGAFFDAPGTIRLSWAASPEKLIEGLGILGEALFRR